MAFQIRGMDSGDILDEDRADSLADHGQLCGGSSSGAVQSPGPAEEPTPCRTKRLFDPGRFHANISRSFAVDSVWDSWESIHEQPAHALLCSVLGTCVTIIVNSVILLAASKPVRWSHHLVSAVYTCCHSTTLLMLVRHGPQVTKTKTYVTIFSAAVFLQVGVSARLMFGPDAYIPFGNRLVFALINTFTMWTWNVAAMLGCWAVDHPRSPYRSLVPAQVNSAVRSLRMTDGITDMLVVRLILQQAHAPCFWFGRDCACVRWRVMAVFAAAFTSVDLALSVFYGMSGSRVEDTGRASRLQRVYKYTNVVSFTCETGILILTLVKLFSSFKDPEKSMSDADRRRSVSILLASFLVTVVTFSLTMLGLKRIAAAVTRVGVSVRSRFSHNSAHSRGDAARPSAAGRQRSASGRHTNTAPGQ